MRIMSWNISRNNKKYKESLTYIKNIKYDVICLQEVTKNMFDYIESTFSDMYIYKAKETFIKGENIKREVYLVILSKKIASLCNVKEHSVKYKNPLRYKIVNIKLNVEFLYIDISMESKKFRILNCHLECVAPPKARLEAMENILDEMDSDKTINIVCGDFNTYNSPLVAFTLGWAFGYTKDDFLIDEEKNMQSLCISNGMENHFSKEKTCLYTNKQLDYILIPNNQKVIRKVKHGSRFGSDHNPICLELG